MVGKQSAANAQPGYELGQHGDDDEQTLTALAANGLNDHTDEGQQTCPGHHGIIEGSEQTLGAVQLHQRDVTVVQNGADIHDPLIPVGLIGVGGVDTLMIGEHELLVVPHQLRQSVEGGIGAVLLCVRKEVGQVGGGVDAHGDDHEEQDGQEEGAEDMGGKAGASGFTHGGVPLTALEDQTQQPQQGKADAGIHHRPLGGAADAPEQSAEEQRQGRLPQPGACGDGQPAVHIVVGHQNEEHAVGINGGDACLHQMHEVKGEEGGAAGGNGSLAKEILEEHIEDGEHQHTEQRACKAPAEGGHAKEIHAQRDDQLAQRGMGDLIGVDILQMLQSGTGMIDLIEVAGVHVGGLGGPKIAFVKERLAALGYIAGDQLFIAVPQSHLAEPQTLIAIHIVGGDAEHGGGEGIEFRGAPLEQGVVALIHLNGAPVALLVGILQSIAAGADGGVVGDAVHIHRLGKGEGVAVTLLEHGVGLGCGHVTQTEEGGGGIDDGEQQHGDPVVPLEGVPLHGEGHGAGPAVLLRHGDPLQRVGTGAQTAPVVHEKRHAHRCGSHRKQHRGGQTVEKPAQIGQQIVQISYGIGCKGK